MFYALIIFIITSLFIGTGVYLWQNSVLKATKINYNSEIADLQNKITGLQKTSSNDDKGAEYQFSEVSASKLKKDSAVSLTPNEGFFITTSILSNKKDRIVYLEMSNSIKNIKNNYNAYWDYSIYVKNLANGEIRKIYSPTTGLCSSVYFPIAWSSNDVKIILEYALPHDGCGSGAAPYYYTAAINPNDGDLSVLATDDPLFINNYESVIYVETSANSPVECGPPGDINSGAVILKNINANSEKILAEEKNSDYTIVNIDSENILTYTVKKVKEADGCSQLDESIPEKTLKIKI